MDWTKAEKMEAFGRLFGYNGRTEGEVSLGQEADK